MNNTTPIHHSPLIVARFRSLVCGVHKQSKFNQKRTLPVLVIAFILSLLPGMLPAADFVFWTETTRNPGIVSTRIMRALTDGTDVKTILESGAAENAFGGIAVDVANGHLYSGSRTALFRVTLDGACRTNLVPAINNVGDVELDLAGGKIYWTEGGGGQNAIRRANLDGSNPESLRNIGFAGQMEGIALDPGAGKLYFSQNVNTGNDTIRSMNLDGSNVGIFITLDGALANAHDVEIDPAKRKLYWNQTPSHGIFEANLDGSAEYPVPLPVIVPPDGVNNGFYFDAVCKKFLVSGASSDRIQSLNLDGSSFTTLVPDRPVVNYIEGAHMLQADYIYWTESSRNPGVVSTRIMRALTDGMAVETVLELGAGENVLGGIAVDVANGYLYCGSRAALFRVTLDGACRVNLVPAINNVGDVELDLAGGKVYWTEGGGGQNAIRRANLDGSNPETLRNIGFDGQMEGIALDPGNGKLYFSQNVNEGNDTIRSMNLDGSDVRIFKTLDGALANAHDVEIDSAKRKLYWNQTPSQGIFETNLEVSEEYPDLPPAVVPLVVPADGVNNGFYYDAIAQKFFVSGVASDRIQSVNLDGSGLTTLVPDRLVVNYIEVAHGVSHLRSTPLMDCSSLTSAPGQAGGPATMHVSGRGMPGLSYAIEVSSDLTTWTMSSTSKAAPLTGEFHFTITEPAGGMRRFFRVICHE